MKKVIFIVFFMAITVEIVFADTVTLEIAQRRAELFFNEMSPKTPKTKVATDNNIHLVWTSPEVRTKSSTLNPLLYVFQKESGGYVIVAGEDVAHPILGYSLSESFPEENIPENMKSMLEGYAAILGFARQNHWIADRETCNEWQTAAGGDNDVIVKLETAQWGQTSPYNNLCPIIDGSRCPTGCVATAIAIIMRYHEYPIRGTGHLDSYSWYWNGKEYRIDGYDLGHEYKWEDMPVRPGFTMEQSMQISQLMYDIGVMLHMSYTPHTSISHNNHFVSLAEHFGYDKNIRHAGRGGYSALEWERMIKTEIDGLRPVLYCGNNSDGAGHSFVIDGYCGHYFSINLGWGDGASFYTLTPIAGHEEDLVDFYASQEMYYQIQPDTGSGYELNYSLSKVPAVLRWDFLPGTTFSLSTSIEILNLYNFNSFKPINVSYFLLDHDLNPKEKISETLSIDKSKLRRMSTTNSIEYNTQSIFLTCRINSSINHGDMIHLCMQGKHDDWIPIMPLRRSDYIEFSLNPISELASIGYTCENPFPKEWQSVSFWDSYNRESRMCFYLYCYKDLFWELRDINGQLVEGSMSYASNPVPKFYMQDDNGMAVFYFIDIPVGTYQLTLRNVKEEVVINFCL